jgi:serine protease Do
MQVNRKGFVAGAVVGASVAAAALAGTGLRWPAATAAPAQPGVVRTAAPVFAPPPGAPLSFADIFQRVAPAVVSIDVTARAQQRQQLQIPGLPGFPFQLPQRPGEEDEEEGRGPEAQATGSGFFISADGYIVTNNHVVEDAERITIRLNDQRELPARLIGRDEGTDLAVLKVEGANFPFVTFERTAKPRVGDWVIAVGNPFNLGGTATAGIVSAYGRDINDRYVDFLQIDAPINRGNSGGPTFDVYGRVIGVNSAIFSPTGGSVGIGFAIPADIADSITKQLIASGSVTRGYIGVTIQSITPELADGLGIEPRSGALVSDVTAGGPASRAGVRQGDIITSVNGRAIATSTELTRAVAATRPGESMRVEVLRDGRRQVLQVTPMVRPSEAELAANETGQGGQGGPGGPRGPGAPTSNVLGMSLAPLDAATRQTLGVRPGVEGVAITSVQQGSVAGRAGLRRGDVVQQIGGRAVTTPAEVEAAVAEARRTDRAAVAVMINREGRSSYLGLRLVEPTPPGPGPGPGGGQPNR